VLIGNGAGSFTNDNSYALPATSPVSTDPKSIAVGDFNGDGSLDLAEADHTGSTISVLLGNGNGTFGKPTTFATGPEPWEVAVGDFNGDGKLDLVTANGLNNTVSVLLGKGNGTFATAVNYSVGSAPGSVAVADFNRDGKLDIVTANVDSNSVSVLLGNIVTANYDTNGGTVSVLLGNGNGTFQPPLVYALPREPISPGIQDPFALAVGDFNKDGKLDVVVTAADNTNPYQSFGYVDVLIGNGRGGISTDNSYLVGGASWYVAVGDFNGDGNLDLVTSDGIMLGNGNGTLGAPTSFYAGDSPVMVAIGDFNGDGKLDLVAANYGSASVSVLLGNGNGTFSKPTSYFVGGSPNSIAVADFDRDGRLDLAVLLGKGDGTFATNFTYYAGFAPGNVVAADFNRDGRTDLALVNGGDTNTISTFSNLADWSTTPKAAQFVISVPSNVSPGVRFSLTVKALDAYGNVVTSYTGTIHFSSTDTMATLPKSYTFTTADQGAHTFTGVVLRKKGYRHITVTDTLNILLTGDVIVDVL
jgi:hypothetical protein